MYSSGGPYPVGSWRCERCDCGSGEIIRDAGDRESLRAAAVAHLELSGHDVTVMHGTREDLHPMRTEVAWQAEAGSSVLAEGGDWPPGRP
jgi:hypothetical protein